MKVYKIIFSELGNQNTMYTVEADTPSQAIKKAKGLWDKDHDKHAPINVTWHEAATKVAPPPVAKIKELPVYNKQNILPEIIPVYKHPHHDGSGIVVTFQGNRIELAIEK